MKLVIEKSAAKMLRRIQPKLAAAIMAELEKIAASPFGHHANAKPLEGTKDGFRLRHGDWRILYTLDRTSDRMTVEHVKPRGDAYK